MVNTRSFQHAESSASTQVGSQYGTTAEFVQKLYRALQDPDNVEIISWSLDGDFFSINDMDRLTKVLLPRMFKHSNLSSFVRQLNKYGFHKIRENDSENPDSDQTWMFKHRDFHRDRPEDLERVKRRGSNTRRVVLASRGESSQAVSGSDRDDPPDGPDDTASRLTALEQQVEQYRSAMEGFHRQQESLTAYVQNLERNYSALLGALVQRLPQNMQSINVSGIGNDNDTLRVTSSHFSGSDATNISSMYQLPPSMPQLSVPGLQIGPVYGHSDVSGLSSPHSPYYSPSGTSNMEGIRSPTSYASGQDMSLDAAMRSDTSLHASSASSSNSSSPPMPYPRQSFTRAGPSSSSHSAAASNTSIPRPSSSHRDMPRILFVDSDEAERTHGTALLRSFGCVVEIEHVGATAVVRMMGESFDLVFMDVSLPDVDGPNAAHLIRSFDRFTPIIAMASNVEPEVVSRYTASGISDVLQKPLTKEAVGEVLRKLINTLE